MALRAFQIFRAGTHTDANDQRVTVTERDLQMAVTAYSPSKRAAPLTLGHPKDDRPHLGAVRSLIAEGEALFAVAEVGIKLVGLVRDAYYKYVSASFFPPMHPKNPVPGTWYLKHVGFLGASPPAVAGMAPLAFSVQSLRDGGTEQPVHFAAGRRVDPQMARRWQIHGLAEDIVRASPGSSYIRVARLLDETIR